MIIFGSIFYPAPNSIFSLIKHFLFQNKGSAEASPYKGGKHPFLSGQNEQGSGLQSLSTDQEHLMTSVWPDQGVQKVLDPQPQASLHFEQGTYMHYTREGKHP